MKATTLLAGLFLLTSTAAAPGQPMKIVCLGDSVTRGVRPGVKAEETFCAYLEKGLNGAGVKAEVLNAGIGGHTAADGLGRLERDVLAHRPDFVVIMFGLNDSWIDTGKTVSRATVADYAADLQRMVAALRGHKIAPILMTANPVTGPLYPPERNARLKHYVLAMREVARREKVSLVDVYARFAEMALEGVDLNSLFTDSMHPNPKGHAVIAAMLLNEFKALAKQ